MPRSFARAQRRAASPRTSRTSRHLSQHFLTDPAMARRLVTAARLPAGLPVAEPGAGLGAVTAVLARDHDVTAYEIDPSYARALRARFPGVRVVCGDFRAAPAPRRPFAVVGNIPYAVTGDIVRWCLDAPALRSATLLTQWEYARARTGGYGRWPRLTVTTWPLFTWRLCGRVPRHAFRPAPRVDGGILHLTRRETPLLASAAHAAYASMIRVAYTGTGGSIRASLSRHYGRTRTAKALNAAGVPPKALAGEVPPDVWLTVFTHLEGTPPGVK